MWMMPLPVVEVAAFEMQVGWGRLQLLVCLMVVVVAFCWLAAVVVVVGVLLGIRTVSRHVLCRLLDAV